MKRKRWPRWPAWFLLLSTCRSAPIPEGQRFPAGTGLVPKFIAIDGSAVRVVDVGPKTGRVVVLVHGLAASMYSWRYAMMPLARAGYRVIAFDNRGFGFSDKPSHGYSNSAYTRLLGDLLDSLGLSQVVLVGHSMGGAIAAEFALARPDRVSGLVLVDAAGYTVRWPFMLRVARWPVVGALFDGLRGRGATARILRALYADPSRVKAQDVDQYYAPLALPGAGRSLRGVLHEFHFDALKDRMGAITAPSLVVWGGADRLIPVGIGRAMAAQLPHAALVLFPGAGHAVPEEAPQAFNRTLLAFLAQGLPAPPGDVARSSEY